jgi:hypothetical protein
MVLYFGVWQIIEEVGIVGKDSSFGEYIIDKSRLWEIYKWENINLSDWAVHLCEKTWMTEAMLADLFNALVFAQDYFVVEKNPDLESISWAQTIYYAKYLLRRTKQFSEIEIGHIGINDVRDAFSYAKDLNKLKPLTFPNH